MLKAMKLPASAERADSAVDDTLSVYAGLSTG